MLATLLDEEAARRQRAQRAMMNVIEDLSEAHEKLEKRVAERTAQLEPAHRAAQLANRAKAEFLAMLGHELRNPLAPIITALELMEMRGGDVLKRERTIIERQTQHLSVLVDDLLDVARIARGIVKLEIERVSLADAVAKAVETTSQQVGQQRHEVAIAIADIGRGIERDRLPRVFDPFVQEQQKLDRSRGGLGLGLAIVRILVQLHGGRIEGESDGIGKGSTFTVHLHRADQVPAATPRDARTEARAPGEAVSVLVVDDNRDAVVLF